MVMLCMYILSLTPGGVTNTIINYLKYTRHEFVIIDASREQSAKELLNFNSVKRVLPLRYPRIFRLLPERVFLVSIAKTYIKKIMNLIKTAQCKYLLTHIGITSALPEFPKDVKVIAYTHDVYWGTPRYASGSFKQIPYKSLSSIQLKSLKRIDYAMFNSYLSFLYFKHLAKANLKEYAIIPPGADFSQLQVKKNSISSPYILYIGRFWWDKRQHFLVEVFKEVAKELDEIKLVLAGVVSGKNWRYFSYVAKLINKYNLKKRVVLLPNISSTLKAFLYTNALLYANPCRSEFFGITSIEAAYYGTYVVQQLPAGNADILRQLPGVTLVPSRYAENVGYWANILANLVSEEKIIKDLGEANAAAIRKKDLSWRRYAKEVDAFIEKIIGEN